MAKTVDGHYLVEIFLGRCSEILRAFYIQQGSARSCILIIVQQNGHLNKLCMIHNILHNIYIPYFFVYVYISICIYLSIYLPIYVYWYSYIYICIFIYVFIFTYMPKRNREGEGGERNVYRYIFTYIYIYTHSSSIGRCIFSASFFYEAIFCCSVDHGQPHPSHLGGPGTIRT